jgi:hypothetical protein
MIDVLENNKKHVDLHLELVSKIDKILKEHEVAEHIEKNSNPMDDQVNILTKPLQIEDWKPLTRRIITTEYISKKLTTPVTEPPISPVITQPSISTSAFRFIDKLEETPTSHNRRENWMRVAILPETNSNLLDRIIGHADISIKKKVSFDLSKHVKNQQDASAITTETLPQQQPPNDNIPTIMKESTTHTIEVKKDKTTPSDSSSKTLTKAKHEKNTERREETKTKETTGKHKKDEEKTSTTKTITPDKKELKRLKKLEKEKEKELKKKEKLKQKELKQKTREEQHKESFFTSLFSKKKKKQNDQPILTDYDSIRNIDLNNESPPLDEDVRKLLLITDNLLGKLPDDVIEDFAKSEDYSLYERVMSKYKIK